MAPARPVVVAALAGFAALFVVFGVVLMPLLTGRAVATTAAAETNASATSTAFAASAWLAKHTGAFAPVGGGEFLGDDADTIAACSLDTWHSADGAGDLLFRGADTSAVLARLGPTPAVAVAYEHGRWLNGGSPAPRVLRGGMRAPLDATACNRETPPVWSRTRNTRLAADGEGSLVLATELLRGADLVADTPQTSAIGVWFVAAASTGPWDQHTLLADTDGERVVALVASPTVAARVYLLTLRESEGTLLLRQSDTRGRTWSALRTHVVRTGVTYTQVAHATLHFSRFSRDTLLINIALEAGGFAFAVSTNGGRTWSSGLTRGLARAALPSPDATWRPLAATLLDAAYQTRATHVNRTATLRHGLGAPRVTMNAAGGVVFSGALYAAVDGAVAHSMSDGQHWSPRVELGATAVVVTGLAVSPAGVLAVAHVHTIASSAHEWRVAFSVAFFETRAGGLVHLDTLRVHAYNARKLAHSSGAFGGDDTPLVALGGPADEFVLAYAHLAAESADAPDAAVGLGHSRVVGDDSARRSRIHLVHIRRVDKIGSPRV